MQIFKKLSFLLTTAERKQPDLSLIMNIIITLLDMISVDFVSSFIKVSTNSHTIEIGAIFNSECVKTQAV